MLIDVEQFREALSAALLMEDGDDLRTAAESGVSRSYYVKFEGRVFPLKAILRLAYKRAQIEWDRPHSSEASRILRHHFEILHITKETEKRRLERQRESANRWARDARFRIEVLDLYKATCVISGCNTLNAIDAAHLLGVGAEGKDTAENGIVFRADIHRLFDAKPPQMSINPSGMTVHFSENCRDHFTEYDGKVVVIPKGGPKPKEFATHWKNFRKAQAKPK